MAETKGKLAGKYVTLTAGRTPVKKEQVHEALEQIFRLNGCLACGLIGIDIHIHGGDPDPLDIAGFNVSVR